MRALQLRVALPWLIGVSLGASLCCLGLAVYLGLATRTDASDRAARQLAEQAESLVRQLDSDIASFDLVLRETSHLPEARDAAPASPKMPFLELPLTARYIGFINVLNEVGDVVADPRSNVSRPVNFAGRDYFQDHLKNPADVVMVGRPFATAPNQHASIPISRRLNRPDGSFAGVVVAGVHLAWLTDLLSQPSPGPHPTITIRRDDGLILMRGPYDTDAIGRGAADPAWQDYRRTGVSRALDESGGIHLFSRLAVPPLVLELTLDRTGIAAGERSWLVWLAVLTLIPGLCIVCLSLAARHLLRHGDKIEAAALIANDESMRLLANMSHELRTPLTGILGQAEMMADVGGLSDRQSAHLNRLTEAGTLMRDIVNRVIDVARPDGVIGTPILTPCDLDPLMRTCLGTVEGEAKTKGVLLTSFIDPATPRRVMLERDRVQQMVINLLMNAVKFTARGSVALRVTGDAKRLRLEVADTGPGIPAAKQSRLFRAYDRLDASASPGKGTGLGLSITERFVRLMGGQIGHGENPGGGSVFWIELPITEAEPSTSAPAEVVPVTPPPEIRHLRIMLADDLELTRLVTAAFLRQAGHAVTETVNGEAAIAGIQTGDFDVLLTDMRMPDVDGLEVTRRVRALPGHRGRIPVVLVTADLLALDASESGQTGVDICVRKPFTRTELLSAVAAASRLTPVPDASSSENPVLNEAALAELAQSLGDEACATHLEAAMERIEALLVLLDSPDATEDLAVRDAVHDLVGVAGLLGLTELSINLRWFDTAPDRAAPAAAVHEAAAAAVRALRRRPETLLAAEK